GLPARGDVAMGRSPVGGREGGGGRGRAAESVRGARGWRDRRLAGRVSRPVGKVPAPGVRPSHRPPARACRRPGGRAHRGTAGGRPLVALSGTASGGRKADFRRVDSDEQWAAVWRDRRGPNDWDHPRPAVDFTRCTVVAVFRGATHNTEGLSAGAVVEAADKV